MDDAPDGRSGWDLRHRMDEYKQRLRQLAVHDDALLDALAVEGGRPESSVIDLKTAALLRVAATVAVDAALSSFQHAVSFALADGATTTRSSRRSRRSRR